VLASLVATISNYALNNFWTFRARAHYGLTLVTRGLDYFLVSIVGLGATTAAYAILVSTLAVSTGLPAMDLSQSLLLLCQLFAIFVGVFFNYRLNRVVTWTALVAPAPPRTSNDMDSTEEHVPTTQLSLR